MAPTLRSNFKPSARLSPSEKRAYSLAQTAGPLTISDKLNRLLTFTNNAEQTNQSILPLPFSSNDLDFQPPTMSIEMTPITIRPSRRYTPKTLHLPLARQPLLPEISYRHDFGRCDIHCMDCNAVHWKQERSINKSTRNNLKFQMCCGGGQILLPPLSDPPEAIRELLQNTTSSSHLFTLGYC